MDQIKFSPCTYSTHTMITFIYGVVGQMIDVVLALLCALCEAYKAVTVGRISIARFF